jgi:hypothetical protein
VPILNPGVGTQKGFHAYEDGNRDDIWIKDYTGQKPYLGQVWWTLCNLQLIWMSSLYLLYTALLMAECRCVPRMQTVGPLQLVRTMW